MARETFTTVEAAKAAGIAVGTFRNKAKAAGLEAVGSVETGKRGRPALLWSASQVIKLRKK